MQLDELGELRQALQRQDTQYQVYRKQQARYEEALTYQRILELQRRSFERDFLTDQERYEGTEQLISFLRTYPLGQLQVEKESVSEVEYAGEKLKEEVYVITYSSSFYDSYEVMQALLKMTGASNLYTVRMKGLDQKYIQTQLRLVLRLGAAAHEAV